jgi:hypothetical protein
MLQAAWNAVPGTVTTNMCRWQTNVKSNQIGNPRSQKNEGAQTHATLRYLS